jgi:hypothetical protein
MRKNLHVQNIQHSLESVKWVARGGTKWNYLTRRSEGAEQRDQRLIP